MPAVLSLAETVSHEGDALLRALAFAAMTRPVLADQWGAIYTYATFHDQMIATTTYATYTATVARS